MSGRQLTERQKRALIMMPSIYRWTEGSLPSLAGRGLVERYTYTEHGRRVINWRLTEAGKPIAAALRQEASVAARAKFGIKGDRDDE